MDSEEEDWFVEVGIKDGAIITGNNSSYVVGPLLGAGGFGAVFKVTDKNDSKLAYAMKVEKKVENRVHSKLKMEIGILKAVAGERKGSNERNHFTAIVDRGKKDLYFFLIMQLVGKSLKELKEARESNVFSLGTGLAVAIQCLEAVEDLHKHSFIHRDLKPANYASGLGKEIRTIYILDFGIARKFTNSQGEIKTPRAQARFKGTLRFASIACHKCIELSMKDDVESWFYLLLDILVKEGVPWKKYTNEEKESVLKSKEASRDKNSNLFGKLKCKEDYYDILGYIDGLGYADRVDYSFIYEKLKRIATVQKVNLDDPYDFEPKIKA